MSKPVPPRISFKPPRPFQIAVYDPTLAEEHDDEGNLRVRTLIVDMRGLGRVKTGDQWEATVEGEVFTLTVYELRHDFRNSVTEFNMSGENFYGQG